MRCKNASTEAWLLPIIKGSPCSNCFLCSGPKTMHICPCKKHMESVHTINQSTNQPNDQASTKQPFALVNQSINGPHRRSVHFNWREFLEWKNRLEQIERTSFSSTPDCEAFCSWMVYLGIGDPAGGRLLSSGSIWKSISSSVVGLSLASPSSSSSSGRTLSSCCTISSIAALDSMNLPWKTEVSWKKTCDNAGQRPGKWRTKKRSVEGKEIITPGNVDRFLVRREKQPSDQTL